MKYGKVKSKYKKQPAAGAVFPPPGYCLAHKVKAGDNWYTLAELYQRSELWDIIFYNFRTYDPKEVNWYLENRYGAKWTSNDEKNYSLFEGDPGFIYIPPQDWEAWEEDTGLSSEDLEVRARLLSILTASRVKKIGFLNPYLGRVTPAMFTEVAAMISAGRIQPRFGGPGQAEYDSENNEIILGFLDTASDVSASKYLHECVHAAQDITHQSMVQGCAEADAYIAQLMYLMLRDDKYKKAAPAGEEPGESEVYLAAWKIARRVLGPAEALPGDTVEPYLTAIGYGDLPYIDPADYIPLFNAVAAVGRYSSSANKWREFDGV